MKNVILLAIAASVGTGGAMANTVQQSDVFTNSVTETFTFDPFDTSLGTLESAVITISGTATLAAGTLSGLQADDNGFAFGEVNLLMEMDGAFSDNQQIFGPAPECQAGAFEECDADYSEMTRQFELTDTLLGDPVTGDNPFSVTLNASTKPFDFGSFDSDPTSSTSWRASGEAVLTYTYAPPSDVNVVPLPGGLSLALGGLAMLGFAGLRRRNG